VIDLRGRDYCYTANEEVLLVIQIETPEAVVQAEAIAAVEGVDALFFGPDDYKLRRGIPINTGLLDSDDLLRVQAAVGAAARNKGKVAGTIAATPAALRQVSAAGYRLNAGGSDVQFLKMGSQQSLDELRTAAA